MNKKSMISIASIILLTLFSRLEAAIITPTDMTGLRSLNGGPVLLLGFDAVKLITEDREIIHFDISGLSGVLPTSTLDIPIQNIDPGLPGGILDLYAFAGDGTVSVDEWDAGTLFHSFTDIAGGDSILSMDITSVLQAAVDNGITFFSLNLRGGNADRYWLSDIQNLPDPTISIVPLPPAIWLFGIGLSLLYGMRRKTS